MILDTPKGFYVLSADAAEMTEVSAGDGQRVSGQDGSLVVKTLDSTDDKRVQVLIEYWAHVGVKEAGERLDRWPGEVWRTHTARTQFTASGVLTLRTASGKVIELTPAGGHFGLAVFARIMAPGEWPAREPQEHHILVLWPLTHDVPAPAGHLPRRRSEEPRTEVAGPSIGSVLALFEDDATPLIRADFTDDEAWHRVIAALTKPVALEYGGDDEIEYVPRIKPIEERTLEGVDAEALGRAYDEDRVGYVLIADSQSMADEHNVTVLYVDLYDEPGRFFRCAAGQVASIEANLAIANMDFRDFADRVDADGVFRGFSQS